MKAELERLTVRAFSWDFVLSSEQLALDTSFMSRPGLPLCLHYVSRRQKGELSGCL